MEGLIADDSEVFVQGLLRALGRRQPGMVQAERSKKLARQTKKGKEDGARFANWRGHMSGRFMDLHFRPENESP